MEKDFDKWNERKKEIHRQRSAPFCYPREVWWCALGMNVGAETDGKNDNFERPELLVISVYCEKWIYCQLKSLKKCKKPLKTTYKNESTSFCDEVSEAKALITTVY